jgi:geranylgeranyl diphosphate synthase, type II
MINNLGSFFDRVRPAVETALDHLIPAATTNPAHIHEAMRYSTLGGGKRVRPCLCVAAFHAYREDWQPVIPVASAIEMIHAYSLIHDDLPAMDNDDFRRGKPSCHKEFGEALAILAGDALLTLAFEVLARCETFPADRLLRATWMLAHAAGTPDGMCQHPCCP